MWIIFQNQIPIAVDNHVFLPYCSEFDTIKTNIGHGVSHANVWIPKIVQIIINASIENMCYMN